MMADGFGGGEFGDFILWYLGYEPMGFWLFAFWCFLVFGLFHCLEI